ncbi:MAG TPA: tRNA adenosine deaminase-associated protein [Candidatus Nanopelagicales bacterium]|jgi:putative tRNA adenosine deaminase-associated protein
MDEDAVDFALAAWREDGRWVVDTLPTRTVDSIETLVASLRAQPSESGVLGFVSIAEDFFLAVRVHGDDTRILLSDVTAAQDWPLARQAVEQLGVPMPEGDELDEVQPAGDLRIFEDLGVGPDEVDLLCGDPELYPDEMLAGVANRIGFGEQFDAALESLPD